ncbi:zinc finger protein 423 [Cephus cinctus]|uniref:Zinc finger protein 423 n=1 Tax=Cephus cinctus TaxID=211228 RepID=A0AAJ7C2N5_CEPCN|nr:zinc finger protein 423 [Cephus cinctus]
MTSTLSRGAILPDPGELDSDGSSGEDRDARKRLHGDLDSTGPKKRRKQTTPVRFPASLMTGERAESEDDGDDDEADVDEDVEAEREGKQQRRSPQDSVTGDHRVTSKDENLNNEFRCQYCSQFFDNKETLNQHIDSEHYVQSRDQVQVKLEPSLEQSESPVNLSGLSIKSFAASWLSGQVQGQPPGQVQVQSEDWTVGNTVTPVSTIPNHLQGLPFPSALAQYLPLPGFPLPDSSQISRPPIGPAPVRIFNPDAYCDLCNKEFCNKYFLKTHKANKHGIYVDSPGQPATESNLGPPVYGGTFTPGNIKMEQIQRLDVAAVPPPPPPCIPTPSASCDVCQKRFKNEESVRKHKQKVHSENSEPGENQPMQPPSVEDDRDQSYHSLSPGAMEALFKQEFGVEQEDTSFMPAPRHLSPQSIQQARDSGFNADRLRRLGVINPDAFCEICCKEYCNKYFLRTHKMKRHGIYIQDSEKSPSNPGAAASWHQVQTSPLNLIVTETTGNSSESSDRPGEEHECKPCGLRFQTNGLHQAHRQKMHEIEEQRSPKQDYEVEITDQRPDSISEDLQKLQTMILQLNGLESSRGAPCAVCGKEFETRLALRSHMTTDHGAIIEEPTSPCPVTEKSPTPMGGTVNCTVCDKEYLNHDLLRKHISEEHQNQNQNCTPATTPLPQAVPIPVTTTPTSAPAAQTERKASVSMTPTSSYCEICNKELCNKYFMKTHMQRMHGIEIENGAQIGGVICNICNKELCSKYFLRVHKHNTHGIVEEGTSGSTKQESYESSNSEDSALKPEQLGDLSHRYFTHFTEVCPICSRRFRSTKWLKAHLLGDHGKAGVDKWRELEQQYQSAPRGGSSSSSNNRSAGPSRSAHQNSSLKIPNGLELGQHVKSTDYTGLGNQVLSNLFGTGSEDQQLKSYRCSYCNFTTTVLPFLFLHERSHVSPQGGTGLDNDRGLQCPICSQGFPQPELLHHHLLTQHQFPGLLTQFQPPTLNNIRPEIGVDKHQVETKDQDQKEERRQSSPQTSSSLEVKQKSEEPAVQVTPQGAYKCAQCGYATANLNRIKKHIRKDHKTLGDPTDSVITELSKTLKDVANKHKVPASYAMPQDMNSNPDRTVMQPFLIEECDLTTPGEESSSERRFAPALIYLPVKSRINGPLTASFTLSPA